jgi:hypothetical protein
MDGSMRPDLADPEQSAAFRRELRGVARGPRYAGLALLALAALGLVYTRWQGEEEGALRLASWAALGLGWLVSTAGTAIRTRYRKERMAED